MYDWGSNLGQRLLREASTALDRHVGASVPMAIVGELSFHDVFGVEPKNAL